jgi:F-type H+-transporting ATPase subunit a
MSGALLLALLLVGSPQEHPAPPEAAPPAHEAAPATSHDSAAAGHDAPAGHGEGAHDPATVLMHHVTDSEVWIFRSKHLVFFCIAAVLVIIMARLAIHSYREGKVPTGLGAFVEMVMVFIRDEIAEKNIGHGDGRKFTPLLCSFFFFILVAALLGLMPFSATSTGNLAVTLALATISFAAQQYAGISKFGVVHHFAGLIPPGLPAWLLPIMIPVEIISMFTKPFALMIRLFANMLAGHMVITTLLLLIPLMATVSTFFGVAMMPISLLLSLFIMMLEVLVAFIQAYIFTLLTSIFIGMYAHPAH